MSSRHLTTILVALSIAAAPVLARDLHVAPTGDDGAGGSEKDPLATIRRALDLAFPGDVVLLHDGVHTGDGNRDVELGEAMVPVRSLSGNPAACIIDCQGSAEDPHAGFLVAGLWFGPALEGVTVRGAWNGAAARAAVCATGTGWVQLTDVVVAGTHGIGVAALGGEAGWVAPHAGVAEPPLARGLRGTGVDGVLRKATAITFRASCGRRAGSRR